MADVAAGADHHAQGPLDVGPDEAIDDIVEVGAAAGGDDHLRARLEPALGVDGLRELDHPIEKLVDRVAGGALPDRTEDPVEAGGPGQRQILRSGRRRCDHQTVCDASHAGSPTGDPELEKHWQSPGRADPGERLVHDLDSRHGVDIAVDLEPFVVRVRQPFDLSGNDHFVGDEDPTDSGRPHSLGLPGRGCGDRPCAIA